jgi:7-carboxy-7-deazaguanine synthase
MPKLIECISTWQGEGPDTGQRMLLTRFKHCNLACDWCDTKVKMRVQNESNHYIEDLQHILRVDLSGLMITGGEPTMNRHYSDTLEMLNTMIYPVANVETNGCNVLGLIEEVSPLKNVKYIVSPKFPGEKEYDYNIERFKRINTDQVYIKLVVVPQFGLKPTEETLRTLSFLEYIIRDRIINRRNIYLMPYGIDREEILKYSPSIFELAERFKINISTRMHIMYDFV